MINNIFKKNNSAKIHKPAIPDNIEMVITGHSHSFCMGVNPSGDLRFEKIDSTIDSVFGVMGAWNGSRDDKYWQYVADNSHGRIVVISWAGNQHNSGFIFANEETFDFVLDAKDRTPLNADKVIIPRSVLEARFEPSLGGLFHAIKIVKRGNPSGIVVLQTPRPKGDGNFILPFIKSSEHFMALAKKSNIDVDNLAISSLEFRLKLWKLIQQRLKSIAEQQGAIYMDVPDDFCDPHGGLKQEFWANDVTHANNKYGQEVLGYMHQVLERTRGEQNVQPL